MTLKYLSFDDQNQTYELYAVVDHNGDLRNGHYIATIKDGQDWYQFNDATVTPVRENCSLGPQIIGLLNLALQIFVFSYHQIYPQQFEADTVK